MKCFTCAVFSHAAVRALWSEVVPFVPFRNRIARYAWQLGCLRYTDALETGKLDLNDLAPKIKELWAKQDEFSKTRVVAEAEMTLQGCQQLDLDAVRSYVADL